MPRRLSRLVPRLDRHGLILSSGPPDALLQLPEGEVGRIVTAFHRALADGLTERLIRLHPGESWILDERESLLSRFVEVARQRGEDAACTDLISDLASRRKRRKSRRKTPMTFDLLMLSTRVNLLAGYIRRHIKKSPRRRWRNPAARTLADREKALADKELAAALFWLLSASFEHIDLDSQGNPIPPTDVTKYLPPGIGEWICQRPRTPRDVLEYVLACWYNMTPHQLRRRLAQAERLVRSLREAPKI